MRVTLRSNGSGKGGKNGGREGREGALYTTEQREWWGMNKQPDGDCGFERELGRSTADNKKLE